MWREAGKDPNSFLITFSCWNVIPRKDLATWGHCCASGPIAQVFGEVLWGTALSTGWAVVYSSSSPFTSVFSFECLLSTMRKAGRGFS